MRGSPHLPRAAKRGGGSPRQIAGHTGTATSAATGVNPLRCEPCSPRASRSFSPTDYEEERIMAAPAQTRESGFKTNPGYKILFEPSPRRGRGQFNGDIIADSTNAHLLFETRELPA